MNITEDLEKLTIGAILNSENALLKTLDSIDASDFMSSANRMIFNTIIDVYRDGGGIDIGLIYSKIANSNSDSISATYLSSLLDNGSLSTSIDTYIRQIKDRTIYNKTVWLAQRILNESKNCTSGMDLLLQVSTEIDEIADSTKEQQLPDILSIYSDVVFNWNRIERGENVCIPTNESVTTSGISGWYPGHLVTIGGYTSVGKSTYLAQIVTDACMVGASVLVFSLEDQRTDKLIKVLSNITDIPQRTLMEGGFGHDYKQIIQMGWEKIRDFKLLIYDDIYSVEEMRLKIKKAKLSGPLNIVCIDFIQNITGNEGIYEKMSKAIISLQQMAKEFGVTIIVLSQVSNESMKGDSDIIGLKGAGELASASDIVIWLKRVKGEGNERKLDVEIRKNRPFGETGLRRLRFSDRWTRIERGY
jgi:replicative DNA helicase